MHEVKLAGQDLDYFRTIVDSALRGDYGRLDEVTITVHDNGQLQFATNEVATGHFGQPVAPLVALQPTDTEGFPPEGSGNPYANVSHEDSPKPPTKGERISDLEAQVGRLLAAVDRAEHMLNVRLMDRA